ncbi:PD-(D/E)XK nuclease family protein [Caldisalinibacter kiritimatiensis]|uniref:DNA 3'-5' helicase n=1 Tax=Caldisalinibacter kiritimatiensis TaxID=1304284 RepID=R1CU82_9FIRM|nr:PD-(D/E)XK nuclease family protein [Caldisalinibacter kiritimatiensis]EOD00239.1 ATP-dependent nuclease subunit B-like protein [Caldisalinibacter kiritimatiensis]
MGDKIVYFGPINNNHKETLIHKAKEYLKQNKGDKFYYILPTGNLMMRLREQLLENLKGAFDLQVITFDDIVKSLLSKELYTKIDDATKETIISNIAIELYESGKINYYKDLIDIEGFISSVSYIIGEIKRSLITPEEFNSKISKEPKYTEIGLIYSEYQRFLKDNNLIDKQESFIKALESLNKDQSFFDSLDCIMIDEFFDFRPHELQIIKEMTKSDIDIYINIPYKTNNKKTTVNNTLEILQDMSFEIQEIKQKSDKNIFEKIGEDIFNVNHPVYEKSEKLKLIKAPNRYLEVKKVCEEIKRLTNKGLELNEIGIVVGNVDNYKDVLIKTLNEERIPSTLKEELKLIDIPLTKEIINLIELKLNNFDKDSVIKVIKSGYLDICDGHNRDKFEYLLHTLKIKNVNKEFKSIINNEMKKLRYLIKNNEEKRELYEERLENFSNLNFIIQTLIDETKKIPTKAPAEEIVDTLLNVINEYNIKEKIKSVYKHSNNYSLLHRDLMALSKLKEMLNKAITISQLAYKNEITLKEIRDILIRLLKDETITITMGNKKGVNILTPATVRGLSFSTIFIMGLVQGEYPCVNENNWFFKEDDYDMFKDIGIDIKKYSQKLDLQSLLFTVSITRPKDMLILSYPESNGGENVSIPSMFLDELLNLFKGEEIEDKINYITLDMDYLLKEKLEDVTYDRELIRHLLYHHYLGNDVSEYLKMLNGLHPDDIKEIMTKLEGEIKRNEMDFNEYDGVLTDDRIIEDIQNQFKDMKFSITHLETYGKCPFRFLYEHVLNVEGIDKDIEEFSSLDKGNVYHEILAIYYKNHLDDFRRCILDGEEFDVQSTRNEIIKITEKTLANIGITSFNNLWRLRIEHITDTVINLVELDLERLNKYKGNLLPYEFEVKFGYEKEFVISVGARDIKLLGKIDRIDNLDGDDSYVVYDYKSSSYGVKKIKDINGGTSFQLPVYIMSQLDKDREVMAGGYIIIKDGESSIEIIKDSKKSLVNKRRGKGILKEEEWDKLLEEVKNRIGDYIERIYRGDFRLAPLECDEYCKLSSLCRYNKERINRKGDSYEFN